MIRLTVEDTIILLGIYNRNSIREIARKINKSTTRVYDILKEMEDRRLVYNPNPGTARNRRLTEEVKQQLRSDNLLKEENGQN
jgi:transposase